MAQTPKNPRKILKDALYQRDPNLALKQEMGESTGHLAEIKDEIKNLAKTMGKSNLGNDFIQSIAHALKGEKGDSIKGDKGDKGDTPIKGVDYFTPQELEKTIEFVLKEATPIKDVHYRDGKDGENGADSEVPGPMGPQGPEGPEGKPGKDGTNPDPKEVVELIKNLPPKDKISISHLKESIQLQNAIGRSADGFMFNGRKIKFEELMHGAGSSGGLGTVTNVATGTGLTGGPITNTGTIALDSQLAPMDSLTGNALKVLRVNAGETAVEYATNGSGTVTDVSVVTANGVSGSVATSTTTPAITLSLGAITPSSVVSTGAIESKTSLVLEDPGVGTNTITLQAPTLAGDYTLTLPIDDGTPSQVLTTDGSGVLSWQTNGAGTGTVTSVAINSANGFGGNVTNPTTAAVLNITTSVVGLLKGGSGAVTAAIAGTDYVAPSTTVNGHALSSNVSLTLNSSDFANEGTTTTVLHGNAAGNPTFTSVVEADISLSNNTTNNATTLRHGFLPILSGNALQFLDGNGNYSTPAATVANSYSLTTFSGQTSVNVVHNFGTYPVVQVIDNTGAVLVPLTTVNNTLNDFTVTFSVSTSGSIIATVGSPQPQALVAANGNYSVLNTDYYVKVTAAGAIITLPTSVGNTGRTFVIKNTSAGDITVNTTSSQTIDGVLTQTLHAAESLSVFADGANYFYF